ncbi:CPBP family intramembrane metalloprotease [Candidatus Saccharibacteria bacterium]|nr:CPBP family intramembrane metalloprotease [Candidatus Saccharibacteria bacterium]
MKKEKKIEKAEKGKFDWKKVGWVAGLLAWVGVSLIACQLVVSYVMIAILGDAVVQPVWTTLYSAIVYILCLLLVIFVPWQVMKMKTNREELGLMGLPTWTDIGLAPVGFVVYFIVAILVMALMSVILPGVNWEQAQEVGFENLFFFSDRILAFVALVILAPVAEEIIFRGWLYGKIRSKVPAWVGILAVSVLFGLMHLGFNVEALQWNAALNIFCMSVVLCVLREITGTIWSGMILHMVKNGLAFYLLFINGFF